MNALDLMEKNTEGIYVPRLDKGQRILMVGRSGSGKSNAEISFPGPSYTYDCDNRFKGVVSAIKWLGEERFKQIQFDYYNPKDGFAAIDTNLNKYANDVERGTITRQTNCFDSIGSMAYMFALDSQRLRGTSSKAEGGFAGKTRGKVSFLHPDDYGYLGTAFRLLMFNYCMPLNELGINTLFSAWVIDRWAKKPGADAYAPSEVVGEKIVGPGNFVEEVIGYFDEMYYFRKHPSAVAGMPPKYTVEFNGGFAKTALGLPSGEFDITGKNFYEFWYAMVMKVATEPMEVKK